MNSRAAWCCKFPTLHPTRTNETLGAQWREFDLVNAVWVIAASRMKTKEAFSVPLCDRAVDILAEARQRARKEPEADSFVFFGMKPKKPVSPMAMMELLRRMKINATVHGFRAAFRMWAADVAHAPFEIAEAALAHQVGNAVVQAYRRSSMLNVVVRAGAWSRLRNRQDQRQSDRATQGLRRDHASPSAKPPSTPIAQRCPIIAAMFVSVGGPALTAAVGSLPSRCIGARRTRRLAIGLYRGEA